MLYEQEPVTPEIARLRCFADQVESAPVIEIQDLFRFSHFERVAADSIDNVVPQRRSPQHLVIPKRPQGLARERILD
jgi:hypothetical protein